MTARTRTPPPTHLTLELLGDLILLINYLSLLLVAAALSILLYLITGILVRTDRIAETVLCCWLLAVIGLALAATVVILLVVFDGDVVRDVVAALLGILKRRWGREPEEWVLDGYEDAGEGKATLLLDRLIALERKAATMQQERRG